MSMFKALMRLVEALNAIAFTFAVAGEIAAQMMANPQQFMGMLNLASQPRSVLERCSSQCMSDVYCVATCIESRCRDLCDGARSDEEMYVKCLVRCASSYG